MNNSVWNEGDVNSDGLERKVLWSDEQNYCFDLTTWWVVRFLLYSNTWAG